MASTWPDTTVETPDGSRTTFTLTSGLTPVNPFVLVGGPKGQLTVAPTEYSFTGPSLTLTFAPVAGEFVYTYFLATGGSVGTPGITTLAAIRTSAQQRADMVNSNFLTTPEWNANINASYQELYDLIVQKYGNDYYVSTPYQFTTDGINERFSLPASIYKLLGVDLQVAGSNSWITLKPFQMIERNTFAVPNMQAVRGRRTNLRYRMNGNNIWLKPLPMSGQLIQLWYVPRLSLLVNDADTVDGVSGWEEYVVIDAAIKALQKEESDCSLLMAQKGAIIARIEAAAENRDAGSPAVVGDSRRSNGWGDETAFGEEWM